MGARIILDLCGGTGSWSAPYRAAGYDVRLVTLPGDDVREYNPPQGVHGILAAPPCTEFSLSGARWWASKDPGLFHEARGIVVACLRIIEQCKPQWWALENPVGRLVHFIGPPALRFDPCDYGDTWTKRTCLWGRFAVPRAAPVLPLDGSKMHFIPPGPRRQELRSVTPPGFARAFFHANP